MEKKFKMIDETFVCDNCGFNVPKLGVTSRNHCPKCLYSIHVDINPGDRSSDCGGKLKAIGIDEVKKDSFKIIYKCEKCGQIKRNISAKDDDFDVLLELMKNPLDSRR